MVDPVVAELCSVKSSVTQTSMLLCSDRVQGSRAGGEEIKKLGQLGSGGLAQAV